MQVGAEGLARALAGCFFQSQRANYAGDDKLGVILVRKGDEGDAIREERLCVARRLQGQARLADAARPGEREQPHLPSTEEPCYLLQVSFPTHERGGGRRQDEPGGRRGLAGEAPPPRDRRQKG